MWNRIFILFVFVFTFTGCQKEVFSPINHDCEATVETKCTRNPTDPGDEDGGGITDPDDESDEDKIKNKKKKAK
jgi:hypothetical protein